MKTACRCFTIAAIACAVVTGCTMTPRSGKSAHQLFLELDYCIAHGGERVFARQTYEQIQSEYPRSFEAAESKEKFLPVIERWEEPYENRTKPSTTTK